MNNQVVAEHQNLGVFGGGGGESASLFEFEYVIHPEISNYWPYSMQRNRSPSAIVLKSAVINGYQRFFFHYRRRSSSLLSIRHHRHRHHHHYRHRHYWA